MNKINWLKKVGSVGSLVGGALLLQFFIYKVEPGERAIVFNQFRKGISEKVYGEGFHFYLP